MKNAILDTNIFLHWDIKSVDWCKELDTDNVTILVTTTVLQELDKTKGDQNPTLRERARNNLSIIYSHYKSGNELRKNVKLTIVPREPKIDWDKEELDQTVMDDRIVAAIIERANKDDIFITDDSTPRIKAEYRKLETKELSVGKLEDPRGEIDKKMNELKNELITYKEKKPKLTLELDNQNEKGMPSYSVKPSKILSEQEIEDLVSRRKVDLGSNFNRLGQGLFPHVAFMIDKVAYQTDIDRHLESFRDYLKEKNAYAEQMSGIIKMRFHLGCEGTVPAEDVICKITSQTGFQILRRDEVPIAPYEPEIPIPMTPFQRMTMNIPKLPPMLLDNVDFMPRQTNEGMRTSMGSNRIELRASKIQHGFGFDTCDIYLKLPSVDSAKNFQIKYEIHASNLPKPVDSVINVAVDN